MSRGRLAVLALLTVGITIVVIVLVAGRGRTGKAPRPRVALPAGGAAPLVASDRDDDAGERDKGDAGSVIAEDARLYPVRTWTFALDRIELRVEDVKMSTALDDVLVRTRAELVVNGGFFDPKGRAMGLAMSGGVTLSPLLRSLSGGVLTLGDDGARLHEAESFVLPERTAFAIQCRPRLVVAKRPNVRSDDGKRSERTALCLRDGGRTLDVVVIHGNDVGEPTGPSLFALGRWLSERGCEDALNLDGGPSTGVAWHETGEKPQLLAPREAVRHAIVLARK